MLKKLIDSVAGTGKTPLAEIPIFPLSSVLFPGGVMPLRIFEQRYMEMTKACLKNNAVFGICLIHEGQETGAPAIPEAVGTFARIQDWDMQQLGVLLVRATGEGRFRIRERRVHDTGLILAQVDTIAEDDSPACPELPACSEFLAKVLAQIGNSRYTGEARIDDPSWVSFRLTEILPVSQAIKQKMLELTDSRMRLEILHRILHTQKLIA